MADKKAPTQGERIVAIEVKLDSVMEKQEEIMTKLDKMSANREDVLKCQELFDRRYVQFQNFELKVKEIIDNYSDAKVVANVHKTQLLNSIIKIGQVLIPLILALYIVVGGMQKGTGNREQGTGRRTEQMPRGIGNSK
jgi:hypothetical protein